MSTISQLLELQSGARLLIMIVLNVCAIILMIDAVRSLTVIVPDGIRTAYLFSLISQVLLYIVWCTPLIKTGYTVVVLSMFGYLLSVPAAFALVMFIRSKRPVLIADIAVLLLNLPFMYHIAWWRYVYILSVGYLFVRTVLLAIERERFIKNEPGRYMVKEGFDQLSQGILFANGYGQISFINSAMHAYLDALGIDEYEKTNNICAQIEKLAEDGGRRGSSNSVIVCSGRQYLCFSWTKKSHNIEQIVCRDVTEEELILIQLEKASEKEMAVKAELETTLNNIVSIETEKEILRVKGNLHDVMAQRLSILHGIVNYDGFNDIDLKKIKELIRTMMPEMYENKVISTRDRIDELIDSFRLIGVNLKVSGAVYGISEKSDIVLKVLRECTTNAVRHGGATEVYANVEYVLGGYKLTLTDNGTSGKDIVFGNGIRSMIYSVESAGGTFEIANENSFEVRVFLPD